VPRVLAHHGSLSLHAALPISSGRGLLELTIDDAGPGIEPEGRELVFERFYRTTASRSMPGSGLGLAIVKQVVTKHGGTISVENRSEEHTSELQSRENLVCRLL